jgi:hypothetical protein
MGYTDHYFEVRLSYNDGRVIQPEQFRTVQDAMATAERYSDVKGAIVYIGDLGSRPQQMIVYNADGSIDVGADVPEND